MRPKAGSARKVPTMRSAETPRILEREIEMKYLLLAAVAAGAIFLGIGWTPTAEATLTCATGSTAKTISGSPYCVPNACASMTFDHAKLGTSNADVIRITGSGRWYVNGLGGNDTIYVMALNGPNCIVGGAGIDSIVGSPFMRDTCILNDGLSNTPDSAAGSEASGDWAQFCKTVAPSPYPTE